MKRSLISVVTALALPAAMTSLITAAPVAHAIPPAACGEPPVPQTFTSTTDVAVPTGPGSVTSTINVSSAGLVIADVDVLTEITHLFSGDLDVTVTSPSGTVVTLTTDNGFGADNVFDGTVWDDDANPGGNVSYDNNQGLVTDHAFTNLVTATPLTPEEALAAFVGEAPNGVWTLTISDDAVNDGGLLDGWSLTITPAGPLGAVAIGAADTNTSIPITAATTTTVSTNVLVSGAGNYLTDINVTTNLAHTAARDLDVALSSPAGTVVTLTTDNGLDQDDVFDGTVWDDDADPDGQVPYFSNNGLATDHLYVNATTATPLAPEEPLGAFIGENPNGTWTLSIADDTTGEGGSLDGWSISFGHRTCVDPPDPDTEVTGVRTELKKPKVSTKRFVGKAFVRATDEGVAASAVGKVKVKLANGKKATYLIMFVSQRVDAGEKAKLKLLLRGSLTQQATARAKILSALKAKRSVTAKVKFTLTDASLNKQKVTRTVQVERG